MNIWKNIKQSKCIYVSMYRVILILFLPDGRVFTVGSTFSHHLKCLHLLAESQSQLFLPRMMSDEGEQGKREDIKGAS